MKRGCPHRLRQKHKGSKLLYSRKNKGAKLLMLNKGYKIKSHLGLQLIWAGNAQLKMTFKGQNRKSPISELHLGMHRHSALHRT